MAVLAGNGGSVKLTTNTVAELDTWSLDIGQGLAKTHAFGDTWEEQTATVRNWTASAAGRFDYTDTNGQTALVTALLAGTSVSLRLYTSGSTYWSGTAFVAANIGAEENGVVNVSYSFTGSGALTYT